uniref:Secreted protein n=1 Tax=Heterorhabditis bacteriophora TaxID=37862 RepID=A0A1I7XNR3_HETBA
MLLFMMLDLILIPCPSSESHFTTSKPAESTSRRSGTNLNPCNEKDYGSFLFNFSVAYYNIIFTLNLV